MARKRMSWDWVKGYPIFIYTVYIAPSIFKVDILVGVKGDQNAGSHGPNDKPDCSYIERGAHSKNHVVKIALIRAEDVLKKKFTSEGL